jgi:hypothetical protein
MNLQELSILRLENQHIAKSRFNTVKEIASWMCAMQAQDFNMSKWALGIRLQESSVTAINKAIDSGELVRTHLLRPTWHLVSSDDIGWILSLTAPQIRSAVKSRDKELGLTEPVFRKSNSVIEKSLRDGNHLTRPELISELVKTNIDVDNNRASHLLLRAETDGIICSGRLKDNRPTYALLQEWIKATKTFYRDEALRELAIRYFTSHGPATLEDFIWWSGLSSKDSQLALELARSSLNSEIIQNKTYWFASYSSLSQPDTNEVFLLPAYDEFLISYRDRTASLAFIKLKEAVSSNGIFYPTIVRNGQVIGTWKYSLKKDKVVLQTNLFESTEFEGEIDFSDPLARFAGFLQKEI